MQKKLKPFIKGYNFRIYPTEAQKELFAKTFGSCRYVYNRLLDEVKAEYEAYKQSCKTPGATK
jgi:putative transposase